MNDKRAKRSLKAVFSADVKGYSRMMGEDEIGTINILKEYRQVMETHIQRFSGRVVDSPGDNLLAEFQSVVDAVECAVDIQKDLKTRNEALSDNKKMEFRIGLNLGDLVEDGGRIYGDGVNVAARIEGLAEPGGICLSYTAYDQVKKKLPLGYEYLGRHQVKNINESIQVYRVLTQPEYVGKVINAKQFFDGISRKWVVVAIIFFVAVATSLIGWNIYLHQSRKLEPASLDKMAYPLPEKPSIAVLPFENLSGDPKQEYFSDGMTDDLITDLSKISGLFVIARNSTFTYKGKSIKIQQVSEELGVRYVLEGSVRKAGGRVRINAQLIDATTGGHLWAERYDGNLTDVFALQDKVNRNIVSALAVTLTEGEQKHARWQETDNVAAYDLFLQGWTQYVKRTPNGFAKAVSHFKKAIELDPKYGRAYAALASTYWESSHSFWSSSLGVTWGEARHLAEQNLEKALQYPTTLAHQIASRMLVDWQQYEEAIEEADRSIVLA